MDFVFSYIKRKKMGKKILNYFWCGIMNIYNKKLAYDGLKKNKGKAYILVAINVIFLIY